MNILKIKAGIFLCSFLLTTCLCQGQIHPPTPLAGKNITQNFLQQNLRYPEKMLKEGKNGTVVVAFSVDEKGTASGHHIIESFCAEADSNALDLVKKILWSPATQEMKNVAYDMEYPIEYNAKVYRRYHKKHPFAEIPLSKEADTSYRIYETYALEETAKPYFADGSTMASYILSNLEYPESAKASEIAGTVRLSFVVEPDGNISNILVKQSVGGGCDNEAIRLLQQTHWIPAVKNGVYVRSHNEQDITFRIGNRNYFEGGGY